MHAHHIIPWERGAHPLIQKAAQSSREFHLNKALNGLPLPPSVHLTGHRAYNDKVLSILDRLNRTANDPEIAYTRLHGFVTYLSDLIRSHPSKNLGEIAKLINY
jgi:hypothetical protein